MPSAPKSVGLPPSDIVDMQLDLDQLDRQSTAVPAAAPMRLAGPQPAAGAASGRDRPVRVEFNETISDTFELYRQNIGQLVGTFVVCGVLAAALTAGLVFGVSWLVGQPLVTLFPEELQPWILPALLQVPFFLHVPSTLGMMSVVVALANRGRESSLGEGAVFLSALALWAVCFVPQTIWTAVCYANTDQFTRAGEAEFRAYVTLGAIATVIFLWTPSLCVLLNEGVNPFAAIAKAVQYTVTNFLSILLLSLFSLLVLIVSLVPCGLGLPFGAPFIALIYAEIYVTARPKRSRPSA